LANKDNITFINDIYADSQKQNTSIIIVDMMNLLFKDNITDALNILLKKNNSQKGYAGRVDLIQSFININSNFIIVLIGHNDTYQTEKYKNNVYFLGMPCYEKDKKCVSTNIGHNEVDDYLITFLYGHYKSLGNMGVFLLSSDHYKWFTDYDKNYCSLRVEKGKGIIESISKVGNNVINIIKNNNNQKRYKIVQNI
jgi:hypothetical protein